MAAFRMKIAGQVGEVHSLFDSTKDYCRAYLTDEPAAFRAVITRQDLQERQAFLDEEARQEGLRRRVFSEPFLERAALQQKFADHLIAFDTLLFHGSAVAADGRGYIFTAPCGTGKSTHSRLWLEFLGDRARMINDDKPFLRLAEGGIWVCGAPWSGKHGLDSNLCVPLQGICLLERGTENRIRPLPAEEGVALLLRQSVPPTDSRDFPKFEALVARLGSAAKLWHMTCTKDIDAARTAFAAMQK